jgi:transposase InsO family protein
VKKTKARCPRVFAFCVGQRLNERPRRPSERKLLGEVLGVGLRTISNWQKQAREGVAPKMGRPSRPEEQCQEWRSLVREEWERQGKPGWRPVSHALGAVPVRLVQETLRELKMERRKTNAERIQSSRVSAKVLAREAVWALDGSHVGRSEDEALEAQVVKDRGTLTVIPAQVGPAADGDKIVQMLKGLKEKRGLPLVLSTDNGPNYICEKVEAYLREEKVVHMLSLPRTPQHNGSGEVAIRELKEVSQAGKGVQWPEEEACAALKMAACTLNEKRARGTKGYKTSSCLDEEVPVAYLKVERAVFYERCVQRQTKARAEALTWREGRMKDREAIWETLEEFELVVRTRGEAASAGK